MHLCVKISFSPPCVCVFVSPKKKKYIYIYIYIEKIDWETR